MTEKPKFNYGNITSERIINTGFHGWINPKRLDVEFCARCRHLEYLDEINYYDGTVGHGLNGLTGNYHKELKERSSRTYSSYDLHDVYSWAAKQGWYQFINPDQDEKSKKEMHFSFVSEEDQKICRRFAKEWSFKPVFVKGN